MLAAVAATWALLVGVALIMTGNGLIGSLLGVRAEIEAFPTAVTGVVMSCYYIGFLAGSFLTPKAVQRVGHIRVFAALTAIGAASAIAHAVFPNPPVWGAMRMVTGFCFAGLYVVSESWLNDRSTNETRGQLLSVYMVIQFAALSGGQFLLNAADPAGFELFALVTVLLCLAVPTVLLAATPAPSFAQPAPMGLAALYRVSPLGVVGTLAIGIGHSAFFGMGAVYAKQSGLSLFQVSLFMTVVIAGGIASQWPAGRLSDRLDRRATIAVMAAVAGAAALGAGWAGGLSPAAVFTLACLFGAMSLPLYSLVVAHANDLLRPDQMVAASSSLILVFGVGAIFGPSLAGAVMAWVGPAGLFFYLGAIHAALGLFALYRMSRRPVPAGAAPLAEPE